MTELEMDQYLAMMGRIQNDPQEHLKKVQAEMAEFTVALKHALARFEKHPVDFSVPIVIDALRINFSGTKFADRTKVGYFFFRSEPRPVIELLNNIGLTYECVDQNQDNYSFMVWVGPLEYRRAKR